MRNIFQAMAAYNRWANARIYAAALALSDEAYRRDVGVFFHSLHGTLNHLMVGDRIWLSRFTGSDDEPERLDAILHDDLAHLTRDRISEDQRIVDWIDGLDAQQFSKPFAYRNTSGRSFEQPLWEVALHFFNHQTHHRGQAHAILSILTGDDPPSLDMIVMQRGEASPDLERLLEARRADLS